MSEIFVCALTGNRPIIRPQDLTDFVAVPIEEFVLPHVMHEQDWDFLKTIWESSIGSDIPFEDHALFRVDREFIEQWEMYTAGSWTYSYTNEEHESNCDIVDQVGSKNKSVYLGVR